MADKPILSSSLAVMKLTHQCGVNIAGTFGSASLFVGNRYLLMNQIKIALADVGLSACVNP